VPRYRNQRAAARVGLDELGDAEWERHFAVFAPLPANLPAPLALRYHGHQFRVYNPDLGDGRGFLFAQLRDAVDGRLLDLATKGSGRTPWSRDGDGRLTLKGGVREVLASEMLEALGVSTSKAFSLFETGEMLFRGDEPSPARSSVLVRLGHSHVRFGTFQRFAYLRDTAALAALLDYCVRELFPGLAAASPGATAGGQDAAGADGADPPAEGRGAGGSTAGPAADTPAAFLAAVARRSAETAAAWMMAGFVHGVLNTDNMNVTGESFDYGPYRFLPTYDPAFTAAYFDHHGLYAYGRQPAIVEWNLEQLAAALLPLSSETALRAALRGYAPAFEAALVARFLARLGVATRGPDDDGALGTAVFRFLAESGIGFEQFFFDWYGGPASAARALAGPEGACYADAAFLPVRRLLETHAPTAPDRLADPYYQAPRPCTLLIDEIESIWEAIAARDDWAPFAAKLAAIADLRRALGSDPAVPAVVRR
jgi:uncharacterized protein YdiU (UPF0061 family)